LLQGTLDMLILKALSLGPLHGTASSSDPPNVGRDAHVEQGALYPALYRIELKGWVSGQVGKNETGRKAKFYKLTKAGQKQLRLEEESWDRLA
jgi:PadR family transcriptional regulator PadR